MAELNYGIRDWRLNDLTYRIESRRYIAIGGRTVKWRWLPVPPAHNKGTFYYERDARAAVVDRSVRHPELEYRITSRGGPLPGFWRKGQKYNSSIHSDGWFDDSEETTTTEGGTPVETKPLSIPRETIVEGMKAKDQRLRDEHDAQQAELAEAYAGKLGKISKVKNEDFLIIALFEAALGGLAHYEDADHVLRAVRDRFGTQPGTMVYETPEALAKLIRVYEAANDTEIEVQPEDNIYQYI